MAEQQTEHAEVPRETEGVPVVGIGASAGGIDALLRLVPLIEPACGIGFVVVQHLDPERHSNLAEILARAARIPVLVAEDGMIVAADAIHVVPPNATPTLEGGRLRLVPPVAPRGQRAPIDSFLVALAEDAAGKAACVILSGTGSDGTAGLRAIKEHGGLTVVQAEAQYDGMMRSALATGLVDYILPLKDIPARLTGYFGHLSRLGETPALDQQISDSLPQICAMLRVRTGHEFKDYKDRTVIRRVQRRMQVLQTDQVADFIERLRREPNELDLLFRDLLIGVTGFFRDAAAFAALDRAVIRHLFDGKGANDTIRVWVPGCSTGEEAYSIAMLLREAAPATAARPGMQIFASDIDDRSLEIARFGRYPLAALNDMPTKLQDRYFMREDGSVRIAAELREMCLFSVHNLLSDPPFSRLDLISCRNLMIYFDAELQNRLVPLFHYALREGGHLFLGSSETVSQHSRLFAVVDKANRIFRRRQPAERRLPEFPLTLPVLGSPRSPATGAMSAPPGEGNLQAVAERRLLERFAPAFVVINAEGDLLHASPRTGKYLELPGGAPDTNILALARGDLRLDLRAMLHRAAETGQTAMQPGVPVGTNGGQQTIDLLVHPLRQGAPDDMLFMVVFRDVGSIQPHADPDATAAAADVQTLNVRQLESDLRATRERLQATTEELESSNEELKSSNEELTSMNEELQSTNEELETSREELQSVNEELQTVNAELSLRVDELGRAASDMSNLLESTQIATLFLDRDLNVMSFTPAARDVFRLVDSDSARPISHVRARFAPDTVQEDAERVLRTLNSIERHVHATEGDGQYIMRVLPYRTVENVISGVVLTFTDVARISAAESRISELSHDLRDRVESLETLLDLVPAGIFMLEDAAGPLVRMNRRAAHMVGGPDHHTGMAAGTPMPRLRIEGVEIAPDQHPLMRAAATGEPGRGIEAELLRDDGATLAVMLSATPLFSEDGAVRGAIAVMVDISDRKAAVTHQQVLLYELQHRVKNILATVSALAGRMLKNGTPADAFAGAFLDRLHAMGRMHELLAQKNWEGTDLRELIGVVLAPFARPGGRTLLVQGPAVALAPAAASTLGMVLNELATNAAKYGALAAADGRVEIGWKVATATDGRTLSLRWAEHDGPAVREPEHHGFGLGFVKRSVEFELDGRFDVSFAAEGLHCLIVFRLGQPSQAAPQRPGGQAHAD